MRRFVEEHLIEDGKCELKRDGMCELNLSRLSISGRGVYGETRWSENEIVRNEDPIFWSGLATVHRPYGTPSILSTLLNFSLSYVAITPKKNLQRP